MGPSCAVEEDSGVHAQPRHDTFAGSAALLCALANPTAAEDGHTGSLSNRSSSRGPSSGPQDDSDMADAAAAARPSSANSVHTTDCHSNEQDKLASHAGSDTGSQSQHLSQADDATMGVSTPEPGQAGAIATHNSRRPSAAASCAPASHAPQPERSNGQQGDRDRTPDDAGMATSFVLHPGLGAAQQQVLHHSHPGMAAAVAAAAAAGPFAHGLLPLPHPTAAPHASQHATMLAAAAAAANPYGSMAGFGGLRGLPGQHALAAQVPMFLLPPGAHNSNTQAAQRHAAAVAAAHQAGTLAVMQAAAAHSAIVLNSLSALHGGLPPGVMAPGVLSGGAAGLPAALIAAGAHRPPATGLSVPHPHGPFLLAHLASQQPSSQHAFAGLSGAPLGMLPAALHVGPHGFLLPGGRLAADAMNVFGGRHVPLYVQQGAATARTTSSGHTVSHTGRQGTAGGGETASGGLRGKRSRSQTHSSVSGEQQSPAAATDTEVAAPTQQQREQGYVHASKRVKQESGEKTEDQADMKPGDMCGDVDAEVQLAGALSVKAEVKSEAVATSAPELKAGPAAQGERQAVYSTRVAKPETDAGQSEEDALRANEGLSSDEDEDVPMDVAPPLRQSSLPLIPPTAAGINAGANILPVITAVPGAGGVWLPGQYHAASGLSARLSPFGPSILPAPVVTTSSTVVTPGVGTVAPPVTVETPPLQACLPTAPSEPFEQQDSCDLHSLIATLTKYRRKRTHKKTACAPTARLASILCGLGLLTASGSSTLSGDATRTLHVVDVSQLARGGSAMQQPTTQQAMTPSLGVHSHVHLADPIVRAQPAVGYAAYGVVSSCKLQASQKAHFVHGSAMTAGVGGAGNKSGRRKATPSRAAV